ncbi:hypothetical protein GGI05_003127, partial [Coemansia sp. RSA 2603]
ALRSALKEDKVFERLISNLELLIQDAKSALEYRSLPAAGKVINTIDMNEDGSQLTVGKSPDPQSAQNVDDTVEGNTGAMVDSKGGKSTETITEQEDEDDDSDDGDSAADAESSDKKDGEKESTADSDEVNAKLQEARELVARLMVLALSSSEPAPAQTPVSATTDKIGSRIPRRTGSGGGAVSNPTARPQSALKSGLRTPMKSAGTRISSFGVASENTPVRSTVVSPTPSGKASSLSGSAGASAKDSQNASGPGAAQSAERDQILDICRKLQQIL